MKIKNYAFFVFPLLWTALSWGCASSPGEPVEGSRFSLDESRSLAVFLSYTPQGKGTAAWNHRQRFLASSLPRGAALYFPARFSREGAETVWLFSSTLSHKTTAEEDLGNGLFLYTVEASGEGKDPEIQGRRYRISFSPSRLRGFQPGFYALEQGIILSKSGTGSARLESLRFDRGEKRFEAQVLVFGE
jgi:hypothetical protein